MLYIAETNTEFKFYNFHGEDRGSVVKQWKYFGCFKSREKLFNENFVKKQWHLQILQIVLNHDRCFCVMVQKYFKIT